MKKNLFFIVSIPARLATAAIKAYQKTFSPDHGLFKSRYPYGYCRHYPTCSEFSRVAIEKYGLVKGGGMGISRIFRCNPWAEPSIDHP